MTRGFPGKLSVAAAVVLAACFSQRPDPMGTEPVECSIPLPVARPNEVIVAVRDFRFDQPEVRVPVGTLVTWINCEPAGVEAHTSTANSGAWASPLLPSAGGSFSRTFGSPGRFDYHCAPHPFMQAAVVVVS